MKSLSFEYIYKTILLKKEIFAVDEVFGCKNIWEKGLYI